MQRSTILSLLLFGAMTNVAAAGEYYRWVDEKGTLHFSDSPPEVSLEIEVTIDPLKLPGQPENQLMPDSPDTPPSPLSPPKPALASTIKLLSPADDATLRNNQGDITLKIATDLPLGKDQSVRAVIDGKAQAAKKSSSLSLSNVDRGSHTIKVQLLQNGKVIATSHSITVFLHRAIQHKAPPAGKPTPL